MQKHIKIIVVVLICTLALSACCSNKKIVLPELENITEIEIIENISGNSTKITDKEEISKLINEIKDNSKTTDKDSVNDQPTNIDNYITVKFHHKNIEENSTVLYLYQERNNVYIEQPYSGIWKLKNETFNSISIKILKESNGLSGNTESSVKKDGQEVSYKPMVKVNGIVYGWVRDLENVKLGDMEFLGEIRFSKGSLSEIISNEDEDFSSNIYFVGSKIYKWDEKSILVESNDILSICEIIE